MIGTKFTFYGVLKCILGEGHFSFASRGPLSGRFGDRSLHVLLLLTRELIESQAKSSPESPGRGGAVQSDSVSASWRCLCWVDSAILSTCLVKLIYLVFFDSLFSVISLTLAASCWLTLLDDVIYYCIIGSIEFLCQNFHSPRRFNKPITNVMFSQIC